MRNNFDSIKNELTSFINKFKVLSIRQRQALFLQCIMSFDKTFFDYLMNSSHGVSDPFMCLADFDSYLNSYKKCVSDFSDRKLWCKKSLINTATSGIFSSDNSIKNYAENIWHAVSVNKMVKQ